MIEIPMTDAQFAEASRRLQQRGIELKGPTGTMSRQGITARYEHANGVLRVTIVEKPFLLPESMIEGQMRSYLQQAMASLGQEERT